LPNSSFPSPLFDHRASPNSNANALFSLKKEKEQLFLSDSPSSLTNSSSYAVSDCCGSSLSLARQLLIPKLHHTYHDSPDRDEVIERCENAYFDWRDAPTYLIFKKTLPDGSTELVGGKARKRGNDIDQWRKRKRFEEGEAKIAPYMVFERSEHDTFLCNSFFFTLTYDRTDLTVAESWEKWVSSDYHDYIDWLRKRFGSFINIRVFVSHKDGYVHIHFIAVFLNALWHVKHHHDADGKRSLRLRKKRMSETEKKGRRGRPKKYTTPDPKVDPSKDYLASGWKHGTVDIEGIETPEKAFSYLLGYMNGSSVEGKSKKGNNLSGDTSLTMNWLFRKRSFSIGNPDLIKESITAPNFFGEVDPNLMIHPLQPKFEYLGNVYIAFFDRPPPWHINFEKSKKAKADVLRVLDFYLKERLNKEKIKQEALEEVASFNSPNPQLSLYDREWAKPRVFIGDKCEIETNVVTRSETMIVSHVHAVHF